MSNKEYIEVTGQLPAGEHGWVSTSTQVSKIRVVNMIDKIGKLVLQTGDATIALTPAQWDVVLNCLVDAVGPTRRVTIAERLDAAAAKDDGGQEFGAVLNAFIGALGEQR